jgi:hypothetical protein
VTKQPRIHNYLDPKFWEAFPNTPAWEFARFVRLARLGSPRFPSEEELNERTAVERSLAYCRQLS